MHHNVRFDCTGGTNTNHFGALMAVERSLACRGDFRMPRNIPWASNVPVKLALRLALCYQEYRRPNSPFRSRRPVINTSFRWFSREWWLNIFHVIKLGCGENVRLKTLLTAHMCARRLSEMWVWFGCALRHQLCSSFWRCDFSKCSACNILYFNGCNQHYSVPYPQRESTYPEVTAVSAFT